MGKTESMEPFRAATGMSSFSWFAKNSETAGRPFNQAMALVSQGQEEAIAQSYDWKQFAGKTIVDVGGSHGLVVGAIKRCFPDVRAICMDVPEVIDSISENKKAKGVEYLAGDMFDCSSFPEQTDVIYMKSILHDWSDEDCIKILKTCHQATDENATIIISDRIVPSAEEIDRNTEKYKRDMTIDMIMLIINGKERTEEQWNDLADITGFVVTDIKMPSHPSPPFITLTKKI